MSSAKKLKVLVVGAGVMGSYHAATIARSPRSTLAGIVDTNSDNGRRLADEHGTKWFSEIPELSLVDAVVIATPTEMHFSQASQVLDQKVPLLLEKPISDDLHLVEKLRDIAAQNATPLMCGFVERFNPAIITALSMKLEPLHISAARHSPGAPRIKTGASWDLLIHDIDLIGRFLGGLEPIEILGRLSQNSTNGAENLAECIIQYDNGCLGHASASRIGQRKIRTLSLTDSERLVEIDLLRRNITVYRNVSEDILKIPSLGFRQQNIIEIPDLITSIEPLSAQLEHFIDLSLGIVSREEELESLLPAHRVIAELNSARSAANGP